uniref:Uncharacterized protein n=1 Tax=Arundo donax TaxID=35708 RepID=A0A0A9AKX0_ARUDO
MPFKKGGRFKSLLITNYLCPKISWFVILS